MSVFLAIERDVARLTLDRVEQKNAITLSMWNQISKLAKEVQASKARVLILRGAGGFFCSGADLEELKNLNSPDAASDYWTAMKGALSAMAHLKIPTVAMIEKYCLGGGCILALTCDLRYSTRDTAFAIPVAKLGFMLDTATVTRLAALMGSGRAKELLFLSDTISGEYASAMGLVNQLFEPAEIESRLNGVIEKIMQSDPQVTQKLKEQVEATIQALARAGPESMAEEERLIVEGFHRTKG